MNRIAHFNINLWSFEKSNDYGLYWRHVLPQGLIMTKHCAITAIDNAKTMSSRQACIDVIGEGRCTGCFACQSVCPRQAIQMVLNEEGFYRPIVNGERCNQCGVCQQYCPVLADSERYLGALSRPDPKAFAAWTRDTPLRLSSSSGGVFSELAKEVLAAGGAVVGCVWGEGWIPRHVLTDSNTTVEQMRGSKYVPSLVGDVYRDVLERLRNASGPVLFSGTPCQIAAMALALNHEQRKRVLLVELVCHGVPSLKVFHRYLSELFEGENVDSYTFRDKASGWQGIRATSSGGRTHHVQAQADIFFQGFAIHHLYNMQACHDCSFACVPRIGDLTLGDFWGCPTRLYDKRGVSMVLANTREGLAAVEAAQSRGTLVLEAVSFAEAVAMNSRVVRGTLPIPRKRSAFLKGMIDGRTFADLRTVCFPNRAEILCRAFLKEKHKFTFLGNLSLAVLKRFGILNKHSA